MKFISSLSLGEGSSYEVERTNVYSSVMALFAMNRDAILQEYPLIISFKEIDVGGVSPDMFSSFYGSKFCDGVSLLYLLLTHTSNHQSSKHLDSFSHVAISSQVFFLFVLHFLLLLQFWHFSAFKTT